MRKLKIISAYSRAIYDLNDENMVIKNQRGKEPTIIGTINEIISNFEDNIRAFGIIKIEIISKIEGVWIKERSITTDKMRFQLESKKIRLNGELDKVTNQIEGVVSELKDINIKLSR